MQIGVDSVWSSPTTLHLRVLVWTGPNRRCIKQDCHIALADIEGLANVLERARAEAGPDPSDDDQPTLWAVSD
jgi:hypothetical protein